MIVEVNFSELTF